MPGAATPAAPASTASIGDREFQVLAQIVYEHCGINLSEGKKTLVQTRLQRRLRELSLPSFKAYCDYLRTPEGRESELTSMVDQITTNKTDFFREPGHLDYLLSHALPDTIARGAIGSGRPLQVWSAGCSSGEEPYTLAMVLSEFREGRPGFDFAVLASDISTRVLKHAALGVYDEDRIEPVPPALRRKYFLHSKDPARRQVRIAPDLRALVRFRRINFMGPEYGIEESMHIVFCRNVIIYFDRPTQEHILGRIARCMAKGSYIFMGHSETLFGLNVPFSPVAPTVYRRT
jgi:chemotaxis protein methyltransferase CheR